VSAVPQIGPRASLLLGMLHGQPMTADELRQMCAKVVADPELMVAIADAGHETDVAIRVLAANPDVIDEALERLHEFGMADRMDDPHGVTLWSHRRVPTGP
jgi:hypothetical protein